MHERVGHALLQNGWDESIRNGLLRTARSHAAPTYFLCIGHRGHGFKRWKSFSLNANGLANDDPVAACRLGLVQAAIRFRHDRRSLAAAPDADTDACAQGHDAVGRGVGFGSDRLA
jgi:hypothetical protein